MSLCFSLQDAFTVFGEYTDLEWRANTDQIIFKLVALIWTLKDGDPKIRDYTTSTFFNPALGNVKNEKNKTKTNTKKHKTLLQSSVRNLENPANIAFRQSEGILLQQIAFESLYIRWPNNSSTRSIKPLNSSFKTSTFKFFLQDTGQMFIKPCNLFFCSFSESSARPTEICSIIFTKRSATPPSQQSNISLVWVPKHRLREHTLRLLFSLQSLGRSTNQIRSRTRATTDRAHVTRVRLNTCQSHSNADRNDPSVFFVVLLYILFQGARINRHVTSNFFNCAYSRNSSHPTIH